nr:hypothetical protein [Tanacetum cinerariifolium]
AKLPVTFWVEAVNTACNVQNRVLINKAHNKTPYELFNGRTPAIGFPKPFGCHVMILNTLDNLVETLIPTVSSPVLTVCFTDSQEPSSETRLISKKVTNQAKTPSLDNILTLSNQFEDILGVTTNSKESSEVEVDNKKDERGIVIRNKARLVAQGHTQEEVIDYEEVFALVARIEAIRLFLAYASFMGFTVYQMDVKSAFLYGTIDEEVNKARLVAQGHTQEEGIDYDEVFVPVARIEAIRLFLAYASFMGFTVYQMDVKSAFLYGTIDEEVYVMQPPGFQDPEYPARVYKVEKAMYGLHQAPRAWYVLQKEDGIFLSQDKYVGDILKKFGYLDVRSSNTPMDKENPWGKDGTGKDVDLHFYRSMIGSLMYLTASRPDIMFAVCACARYALMFKPTIYVSHIRQFWSTTRIETTKDGTQILTTLDGVLRTVTKSSLRRNLKIQDEEGISSLPDTELFENLTLMGYNISPNQKFTFQKGTPTEPHHTPSQEAQPSSHTHISLPSIPTVTSVPTIPIPTIIPSDTTPIRQYTRRARIAQSSALPPVADEPASPMRDVSQGEAFPTDSGFIADQDRATIAKSSTLPYDSAPRVTSLAAEEGSMQQSINELTALCTSLQRQHSKLLAKFQAQEVEINWLKERVKILEDKGGVIGDRSRDDAPIKERRIDEEERFPLAVDPFPLLPPATEVPTSSDVVPTASPVFATATVVTPYRRRKGKKVMVESETPKKHKLQEQIDAQIARELKEQLEREDQRRAEQIARDAEIARIHAEEELQSMIDGLYNNNETVAKYLEEYY